MPPTPTMVFMVASLVSPGLSALQESLAPRAVPRGALEWVAACGV